MKTTNRRCHDGISYCYSGSGPCDKSKLPPDWNGMCAYQDRPDSNPRAILDALLDQLADAKCAVRDGLYTYAIQCIETAEILAKGIEDGPTPTNGR